MLCQLSKYLFLDLQPFFLFGSEGEALALLTGLLQLVHVDIPGLDELVELVICERVKQIVKIVMM